jgi:hypothetical protein
MNAPSVGNSGRLTRGNVKRSAMDKLSWKVEIGVDHRQNTSKEQALLQDTPVLSINW